VVAVPVQIELDGARSEVTLQIAGEAELKDHPIPLEKDAIGLGPGIDTGRCQPRRQRLLVRLRAGRPQAHDHRGRRPANRAVAGLGVVDLARSRA